MTDDVPVIRNLPEDLHVDAAYLFSQRGNCNIHGISASGRALGTRNFVLIVPTSMCASHEATQISMMAEFLHYSREKFPNVDGVVAIPHNKGCGCRMDLRST